MTAPRPEYRRALVCLVLALVPTCLTQFIAFWLAARILRRAADPAADAQERGLAVAAQTCSVFMIPVTGLVAVALSVLVVPWFQRVTIRGQEAEIVAALRHVVEAQTEWRRRDPGGNGVHEYLTEGIRALHDTPGPGGAPLALIPAPIARADSAREDAVPFRGYWFRALSHDHEGLPYRNRAALAFAVNAYPAEQHLFTGRQFLVNETGTIWQREGGAAPVREWPARDPSTQGWRPVR